MSLLMDALRKAEEAKRAAAQQDRSAAAAPPASTDADQPLQETYADIVADHLRETSALPDTRELSLEPLDQQTTTEIPPPAARKPQPQKGTSADSTPEAQRRAIQNAFTAKSPAKTSADRAFIAAVAAVGSLCVIGGIIYVWMQTQPRSLTTLTPPPAQMASAPASTATAPLPATPLPQAPQTPQEDAAPIAPPEPPPAKEYRETRAPARSEAAASADPIRISQNKPRINPLVEEGYAALQRGNMAQAQQAYERMQASDPRNLDALYGLAAIAVARKQTGVAEDYYLRMLEVDPRDPVAHAGLAGLTARSGGNAESRLKTLIADQPDVPQLQFALGNVYAQNQRWRDAQQAYFMAYKNDSENPDAAFNLAISLDQMHQSKLAMQYYGEALRLADTRPAAFSREQVQARLSSLQGATAP